MKQTEKISKQRFTFLPISMWWILKVAFAVAGFALWGWSFVVAVVVGACILWEIAKTVLSCLVSLLVLAVIICLVIVLIF